MNSKLVKSFALIMLLSANLAQATLYEVPNSFASVAKKVVTTTATTPVEQASRFSWIVDGLRSGLTAAKEKGAELLQSTRTLITENPKTAAVVGGVAVTGAAASVYAYRSGYAGKAHSYCSNGLSYATEKIQSKYQAMPTISSRAKWATGAAFVTAGTLYLAYKNGYLDKAIANASEYLSKADTSVLPTVNVTMPSTEAIATYAKDGVESAVQFTQESAQKVAEFAVENKAAAIGTASATTLGLAGVISKLVSSAPEHELLTLCRSLSPLEVASKDLNETAKVIEQINGLVSLYSFDSVTIAVNALLVRDVMANDELVQVAFDKALKNVEFAINFMLAQNS